LFFFGAMTHLYALYTSTLASHSTASSTVTTLSATADPGRFTALHMLVRNGAMHGGGCILLHLIPCNAQPMAYFSY
jgi:hypothetical protein